MKYFRFLIKRGEIPRGFSGFTRGGTSPGASHISTARSYPRAPPSRPGRASPASANTAMTPHPPPAVMPCAPTSGVPSAIVVYIFHQTQSCTASQSDATRFPESFNHCETGQIFYWADCNLLCTKACCCISDKYLKQRATFDS